MPKQNQQADTADQEVQAPTMTVEDSVSQAREVVKPVLVEDYPNGVIVETF